MDNPEKQETLSARYRTKTNKNKHNTDLSQKPW